LDGECEGLRRSRVGGKESCLIFRLFRSLSLVRSMVDETVLCHVSFVLCRSEVSISWPRRRNPSVRGSEVSQNLVLVSKKMPSQCSDHSVAQVEAAERDYVQYLSSDAL